MEQAIDPPWQDFVPPDEITATIFTDRYPAEMPDGTRLELPLRDLGDFALAGFIANQASFAVLDRLTGWLAEIAGVHRPDVVVGLPTLGHVFGAGVARALGHANWVAPGTSRKLWYDEALSVPLASVTSPQAGRRLWLDPRLVDRLRGRRVLLIDDVVSTGASILAGLALLRIVGVQPVAVCAAMLQGDRWAETLPPDLVVQAVFATARFARLGAGWARRGETERRANCPLLPP
jgi:adenine/guanine phosphoribosyltransferase-like PRPP-binding protein